MSDENTSRRRKAKKDEPENNSFNSSEPDEGRSSPGTLTVLLFIILTFSLVFSISLLYLALNKTQTDSVPEAKHQITSKMSELPKVQMDEAALTPDIVPEVKNKVKIPPPDNRGFSSGNIEKATKVGTSNSDYGAKLPDAENQIKTATKLPKEHKSSKVEEIKMQTQSIETPVSSGNFAGVVKDQNSPIDNKISENIPNSESPKLPQSGQDSIPQKLEKDQSSSGDKLSGNQTISKDQLHSNESKKSANSGNISDMKKTKKKDKHMKQNKISKSPPISEEDKKILLELYIEVESLADDVLKQDPKNEMVKQLAPHLEETLKDIELGKMAGIHEGLLHLRLLLHDLLDRLKDSDNDKSSDLKDQSEVPLSSKTEEPGTPNGKQPVDEVIPDPIYIAPRGKEEENSIFRKSQSKNSEEVPSAQDAQEPRLSLPADHKIKNKTEANKPTVPQINSKITKESDTANLKARQEDSMEEKLTLAESMIKKNPKEALAIFEKLLETNPKLVQAIYGQAKALDKLAEVERSNSRLEQAIYAYRSLLDMATQDRSLISDELLLESGLLCATRMGFRGMQAKAVRVLQQLSELFPENVDIRKKLGVAFLMMNQPKAAQEVFKRILQSSPEDGFAQVHYGFILKTEDGNDAEAITYLEKGIANGGEGTVDGRFYFHLGDSLQRLGQTDKAHKVYDEGVSKGLFLNRWQRSLYNVASLKSQPIWSLEETTYSVFFRKLENQWQKIKQEAVLALQLHGKKGYRPETENLKDTGDWRQFELFARGKMNAANCAIAPFTCSLIEEFKPAAGCKRGQVKFSLMEAGTHVWPHTGPTNCRLRSHLGLVVPDGLQMRVAEEFVTWTEGKVLVFDDSWEHEVWHKGNTYRLVLIVDVWHPDLSDNQRKNLSPI